MSPLRRWATIYEINTWVWLSGLSALSGRSVDLGSVPAAAWDAIAEYGFDAVWLMGVWERSRAGIAIANRNPALVDSFYRALPDFQPQDNVGSAYCVRRYVVDQHLGGPEGLARARHELARRGIRLLLDFVPNHIAPDSPWVVEHPEHFIQGTAADLRDHPDAYIQVGETILACGRDPYFSPWADVVQVNAFDPAYRQAAIELVLGIAAQCDGLRCDMAMLLINNMFARTWAGRAGPVPTTEYWPALINAIRSAHAGFVFIAEAYWDLEWELQQQGFDFCYDKKLYDLLEHSQPEGIRLHLGADLAYQEKLVRFIENHDEPRAATLFAARAQAAAVTIATVPGVRLFHEGQFEGRRTRVPVFLDRRREEPVDSNYQTFYRRLLAALRTPPFQQGQWALCACSGWPDNLSCEKLGAWCWTREEDRSLVVVNLTEAAVQARVHVPWHTKGRQWRLQDTLSDACYDRDGDEMQIAGLYVELPPGAGQILSFFKLSETAPG